MNQTNMNQLIIDNFTSLCAMYWSKNRNDLLQVHENALRHLKLFVDFEGGIITPSKPVLCVTEFDGVNTRNKVLKLLQSNSDLEEVTEFKKNKNYHKIMNDYIEYRHLCNKDKF
jgi:hypothetical protein